MIRSIVAAVVCCVVTGCATVNPMAFDKKTTVIDTKEKSILLMAIEVSRSDDSRWVPKPFAVKFAQPGAQSKEERQNFKMSEGNDTVTEGGKTVYLARMALVNGAYKLYDVTGMASAFPLHGFFVVPLNVDLQVKPNSVTYVGRITAKMRDRKGDEFRAGPLLPLIDQAVTGFSGSTWDVSIDNQEQKDLALFRANFPVLKDVAIDVAPLPAFDRAAAQLLWDGNFEDTKKAEPMKPAAQVASK